MARKITFEDKVTKNVSTEEDKYKITAKDVNEIKSAVNENAEKIDDLNNETKDTGWLELTLNDGYTNNALASSGKLMYRRIGHQVFLKGSCKGFAEFNTSCGTLPTGFRPSTRHDFYVGTGGFRLAKAMVSANGAITLIADTGETASSTQWYSFCTSFITDEDFPS